MKLQTLFLSLTTGLVLTVPSPAHCADQGGAASRRESSAPPPGESRFRFRERFDELQRKEKEGTLTEQEQRQLERLKMAFDGGDARRPQNQGNRRMPDRDFRAGDRPEMSRAPGGQPGTTATMFDRVLTEEQRTSLRTAMEEQRDQMREVEEKLRDARHEMMESTLAGEFKENAVRKKAMAAAKLEAELTVLRAKAISKMKPALSHDQIQRLKNPPPFAGGDRPQFRRDDRPRNDRPPRGQRDENDLPPKPKAD